MFSKPLIAAVLWPPLCVCSSCTVVPWDEDAIPAELDSSAIPYSLGLSGKQHQMILQRAGVDAAESGSGCLELCSLVLALFLQQEFSPTEQYFMLPLLLLGSKKIRLMNFYLSSSTVWRGWVCCGVWKKNLGRSYWSESSLCVCSSGLALQARFLPCHTKCLVTVEVGRQVFDSCSNKNVFQLLANKRQWRKVFHCCCFLFAFKTFSWGSGNWGVCLVFTACVLLPLVPPSSSTLFLGGFPSLESVPAVPGVLGASVGMGRAEKSWSVHGTPSCCGFVSGGPLWVPGQTVLCAGELLSFSWLLWCLPSSGMCVGTARREQGKYFRSTGFFALRNFIGIWPYSRLMILALWSIYRKVSGWCYFAIK